MYFFLWRKTTMVRNYLLSLRQLRVWTGSCCIIYFSFHYNNSVHRRHMLLILYVFYPINGDVNYQLRFLQKSDKDSSSKVF